LLRPSQFLARPKIVVEITSTECYIRPAAQHALSHQPQPIIETAAHLSSHNSPIFGSFDVKTHRVLPLQSRRQRSIILDFCTKKSSSHNSHTVTIHNNLPVQRLTSLSPNNTKSQNSQ
jgi:hypothetical protein